MVKSEINFPKVTIHSNNFLAFAKSGFVHSERLSRPNQEGFY